MLTNAANSYLDAGLCVLPARRPQKRPAVRSWKQYQQRLSTTAELSAWMANDPDAICILCGAISGNLEMIDFDAGGECFSSWWDRLPPELRDRLVVEITPSGGYHVIYRCAAAVCGNLKLAQRRSGGGDKIVTLIETRGEGGLFLCAPTMGYILAHGDLCALPVLTEAERDVLLQAAWELNEYVPPVIDGPPHSGVVGQRAPISGEQGNSAADISHIAHCPPHNGALGQTSASSAAQVQMSANNSHSGDCPSHNANVGQTSASSDEHGNQAADNSHRRACPTENGARPGDDFNMRGDVRAVLEQHGWVRPTDRQGANGNEYWRRPGKTSNWSATLKERVFYVFSSNAAPFEPNRAYSPFSVYALLNHAGDFEHAARSLRQLGYGGDGAADNAAGVDISAIVQMSVGQGRGSSDISHSGDGQTDNRDHRPDPADPGQIPEHLFHVPGFIAEVMAFTLGNAPYPNVGLAFCGAIALQSFLAGRKVRTPGDLRPNIYLLALASSGTGKDFPRKVNSRVLFEVGLINAVGDKFASGEGIQDALVRTSAMLFQNDEMDGVLRQINLDRENRRESTPNVLLTLYTSANDIYPVRVKAGQKDAVHIDQPHLTLFGTATPQYFYESLSQRMLTNGFFARMIIIDVGKRGAGQDAGSPRDVPEPIMQTARWWAEYQPGTRHANLLEMHPDPRIVPLTSDAVEALDGLRAMTEVEYDRAEERRDEVARTAWSRTCENATKLALIYACSENHEDPVITLPAVEWATAFAMHQTRRQLFLAQSYVAENPFHAECLKVVRKLREAPGQELAHSILLKRMKMKTKDFKDLVETLMQRGDVIAASITTPGRTGLVYRLVGGGE